MTGTGLSKGLIALLWMLVVVAAVRLGEGAFGLWQDQRNRLSSARERLGRLMGWLSVQEDVAAREREALGSLTGVDASGLGWLSLQELQELARAGGLAVTELRPTQVPGPSGQPPALRLDLKVEGPLGQFGTFLQQVPDRIPGIRLETLQLLPQAGGRAQALLRLNLSPEVMS